MTLFAPELTPYIATETDSNTLIGEASPAGGNLASQIVSGAVGNTASQIVSGASGNTASQMIGQ